MNIETRGFVRFLLSFILIFVSHFSFSTQVDSPDKVLVDFYHAYMNESEGDKSEVVDKYVMSNVIKSVTVSSQCNYDSDDSADYNDLEKTCARKRDCKNNKGDYICNWDGVWVETDVNYFTKSQDIYPSWNKYINVVLKKRNIMNADYEVSLGKSPEPVMKLKVLLVPVGHSWKISRVTKD